MKSHSHTILCAMVFGGLMMSPLGASAQDQPDESVEWMIYLGGNDEDYGEDIALDGNGNLFISGSTDSFDFEGGNNTYHGGGDAFVAKISASGALQWVSYLGGSGTDESSGLALDAEGNVFVSGWTNSPDFEGTNNAYHGGGDTFVAKLNASGALQWATYLGGGADDETSGIGLDADGNAYVAGTTRSSDFEGRINNFSGERIPFVVKMDASGALEWMKYVGGTYPLGSAGAGIAVDSSGNALVVGGYAGWDTYTGVIWKVNPSGAVLWSAIFTGDGWADSINVDNEGNIFVTYTYMGFWWQTHAALQKLNASGSFQWSCNLGDGLTNSPNGVDIDEAGRAFVVGSTGSNAFVKKVSASGMLLSTDYFGGNATDKGWGIVLDGAGNAFVAGWTSSTNFEGSANANHGGADAFVMKLHVPPCPTDLDGDNTVGVGDFFIILGAWGGPDGDTNGDGTTDVLDFWAVIGAWGPCP